MTEAVLFDFDGTLMNTEPAIMQCYAYLFRKYRTEAEFTPERQIEVLGPALEVEMRKFFPEQDPLALVEEYRLYQVEHIQEWITPMEHAIEMLETIRNDGCKTGILTTRLRPSLEHLIEVFHMESYFDLLIAHEDVTNDKPDPEGALRAMKELEGTIGIVVGDSITDIRAGKNAGLYTIAYPSNPHKRQQLIDEKPDYLIEDLNEIPDIIKTLRNK